LKIIQNVDFEKLNIFLDIYGDGYERDGIVKQIASSHYVKYKGVVSREELIHKYEDYTIALVPLSVPIYGAVPSKIYELINNHIPIFYCGSGEASKLILDNKIGLVVGSIDYKSMEDKLKALTLDSSVISEYRTNSIYYSYNGFNFNGQFKQLIKFIE